MSSLLVDKSELGPLISPRRNKYHPIYNWHSFKHGFSKELVEEIIGEFKLESGSWVLDPFCGGGTTLLACKQLGIKARGFDILPFSVYLTNVKLKDYDESILIKQLKVLRENSNHIKSTFNFPNIPIVKKAFQEDVKKELKKLKQRIDNIKNPKTRNFFNLGLLGILESVSNTSKAGGFLRIIKNDVSSCEVKSLFLDKVTSMISDVIKHNNLKNGNGNGCLAKLGDARKLQTRRKFDSIITSPPYPNRHDYTRIYSLEMIFDFISSNAELKQIRYDDLAP